MTNNKTSDWIEELNRYYTGLWQQKQIPTDSKHPYIVAKESWKELIHPDIWNDVGKLNIRFHSRTNPKSSQLLALNLFLLGSKCGVQFFRHLFSDDSIETADVHFEWIDETNPLKQGGTPSNHDVLVDCGKQKYLIEMKFTEHTDAPCGTSKQNEECSKRASVLRCPLESAYETEYYPVIRSVKSPYVLSLLEQYSNDCPFLHGEQYQIMRYILLCSVRSNAATAWQPMIIFPRKNRHMDAEIEATTRMLREPSLLTRIYLEDAIAAMETCNAEYSHWLNERYII